MAEGAFRPRKDTPASRLERKKKEFMLIAVALLFEELNAAMSEAKTVAQAGDVLGNVYKSLGRDPKERFRPNGTYADRRDIIEEFNEDWELL